MALICETIATEQGKVGLFRMIQEVEATLAGGSVFAICHVGVFMHVIKETTSRVEMPLGMTLKI